MTLFAAAVFWLSIAFIAWTYLGFPFVLLLRAARGRDLARRSDALPRISYVIVVHNERAVIDEKLANLETLDYPREHLQVVIASDGSDDGTNDRIDRHTGPTPLTLVALSRVGKNAALNAGVEQATGDILVFSDADSMLEPRALRNLVAPFGDEAVGCVGGDYHYARSGGEGEGERAYWSVDRIWKRLESRGGSMTSATGQIYAIRRSLFQACPDGVTDDFFVSTGAIAAGKRLWFEPTAIARGPVADSTEAEFRRKVRMMGRGFASVWARRALLDARTFGWYSVQLGSHKLMRRVVGVPLIGLLLATPLLLTAHPLYAWAGAAQLALHACATIGWFGRHRRLGQLPIFGLPLFFDMVNIAGLIALGRFLGGRQSLGWEPYRPSVGAAAPSPTEGSG